MSNWPSSTHSHCPPSGCKVLFLLIICLLPSLGALQMPPVSAAGEDPIKLLFIGSSYFNYYDLDGLVRNLAESAGKEVYVEGCGFNGLYLANHAEMESTEEAINSADWDYVILQGVGKLVAYPDNFTDHPVAPALTALKAKILANNPNSTMVFCLPWAFEDGMTWLPGWNDTYEDMQDKVNEQTLRLADEIGFAIAPAGVVWQKVLREKGYPLHYLHLADWNHPNMNATYLTACVVYSSVFQESCVGNGYTAYLDGEMVDYFQTVATSTVLDDLEKWHLDCKVGENCASDAAEGSVMGFPLVVFLATSGVCLAGLAVNRKNFSGALSRPGGS